MWCEVFRMGPWREEIEKATDNVKRKGWDKWMRKEWHRAVARGRWGGAAQRGGQPLWPEACHGQRTDRSMSSASVA